MKLMSVPGLVPVLCVLMMLSTAFVNVPFAVEAGPVDPVAQVMPMDRTRGGPIEYHNATWDISNAVAKTNVTIWMNANLTVKDGGTLTLKNVTMIMNCSYDGQYVITVNSGGKMYVMDLDGDKDTWSDASHITNGTANKRWRALEESGGRLDLVNSEFDHAGWSYNDKEVGLQFYGSDVLVSGSRIHTSWEGLSFWWPFNTARNFTVKDCWINNTNLGIFMADKSSVNITNTIIENSSYLGIQIYAGTNTVMMDHLTLRNNNVAVYSRFTDGNANWDISTKNILANSTISGSTLYDVQITGAGHLLIINSSLSDAKVFLENSNCYVRYFYHHVIKTTTATDFPYPYSDIFVLIDGSNTCIIPRFAGTYGGANQAHTDYNGVSTLACLHSSHFGGSGLNTAMIYNIVAKFPYDTVSVTGLIPASFSTVKVDVLNHPRFYVMRDLVMKDKQMTLNQPLTLYNGTLYMYNSSVTVQSEIFYGEEDFTFNPVHLPSDSYGRIVAQNSTIRVRDHLFLIEGVLHLINSSLLFQDAGSGWSHSIVAEDDKDCPATIILEDYDNDPSTTDDGSFIGGAGGHSVGGTLNGPQISIKNSKMEVSTFLYRDNTGPASFIMENSTLEVIEFFQCEGSALDIKDSEILFGHQSSVFERFQIRPGVSSTQSLDNVTIRETLGHGLWISLPSIASFLPGTLFLNDVHFKDNPNGGDALMIELTGPDNSFYLPGYVYLMGLTFDNISGNYIEVTQANNRIQFLDDGPLTFYECDITDAGSAGKVVATPKTSQMYLSFVNSTIAKNDISSVANLKVDIAKNISVLAKNTDGTPLEGTEFSLAGAKTQAVLSSEGMGGTLEPTSTAGYSASMSFVYNRFEDLSWSDLDKSVNITNASWQGPINSYGFKNVPRTVNLNNPYTNEVLTVDDKLAPILFADETPQTIGTGNEIEFSVRAMDELGLASAKVQYMYASESLMSTTGSRWTALTLTSAPDPLNMRYSAKMTVQNSADLILYYIELKDIAGNLLSTVDDQGSIVVFDDELPVIMADLFSPPAELGGSFTAKAMVTDNTKVTMVLLDYSYLGGHGTVGDPSPVKTQNIAYDDWTAVIDMPVGYTGIEYRFVAYDEAGNQNTSINIQVNATDTKPPFDLTDTTAAKHTGGETMTFGALVQDKVGVSRVWVDLWWINESHSSLELHRQGAHYIWTTEFSLREEGGTLHYILKANDTSNNTASTSERSFVVDPILKDTIPPRFVNDLTPSTIDVGSDLTVSALVLDDTSVKNVTVTLSGAVLGTFQMLGGPIYGYGLSVPLDATGTIGYTLTAYDDTGNKNTTSLRSVTIVQRPKDTTAPVLADMTDISADAGAKVFIVVVVKDNVGIDAATVTVRYTIDNGTTQEHVMTPQTNDIFVYEAQTTSSDKKIVYAFNAKDTSGNAATPLTGFMNLLAQEVPVNPDSDGDGMPNTWEIANGLDPNVNDAGLDADGDGATNLAEYKWGTDPNSKTSVPPVKTKIKTESSIPTWVWALAIVLALLIVLAFLAGRSLGGTTGKPKVVAAKDEEEVTASEEE